MNTFTHWLLSLALDEVLKPALAAAVVWLVAHGTSLLRAKTKNENLLGLADRLDAAAPVAAAAVAQSVTDAAKLANGGKLTPEAASQAFKEGLQKIKDQLTVQDMIDHAAKNDPTAKPGTPEFDKALDAALAPKLEAEVRVLPRMPSFVKDNMRSLPPLG